MRMPQCLQHFAACLATAIAVMTPSTLLHTPRLSHKQAPGSVSPTRGTCDHVASKGALESHGVIGRWAASNYSLLIKDHNYQTMADVLSRVDHELLPSLRAHLSVTAHDTARRGDLIDAFFQAAECEATSSTYKALLLLLRAEFQPLQALARATSALSSIDDREGAGTTALFAVHALCRTKLDEALDFVRELYGKLLRDSRRTYLLRAIENALVNFGVRAFPDVVSASRQELAKLHARKMSVGAYSHFLATYADAAVVDGLQRILREDTDEDMRRMALAGLARSMPRDEALALLQDNTRTGGQLTTAALWHTFEISPPALSEYLVPRMSSYYDDPNMLRLATVMLHRVGGQGAARWGRTLLNDPSWEQSVQGVDASLRTDIRTLALQMLFTWSSEECESYIEELVHRDWQTLEGALFDAPFFGTLPSNLRLGAGFQSRAARTIRERLVAGRNVGEPAFWVLGRAAAPIEPRDWLARLYEERMPPRSRLALLHGAAACGAGGHSLLESVLSSDREVLPRVEALRGLALDGHASTTCAFARTALELLHELLTSAVLTGAPIGGSRDFGGLKRTLSILCQTFALHGGEDLAKEWRAAWAHLDSPRLRITSEWRGHFEEMRRLAWDAMHARASR